MESVSARARVRVRVHVCVCYCRRHATGVWPVLTMFAPLSLGVYVTFLWLSLLFVFFSPVTRMKLNSPRRKAPGEHECRRRRRRRRKITINKPGPGRIKYNAQNNPRVNRQAHVYWMCVCGVHFSVTIHLASLTTESAHPPPPPRKIIHMRVRVCLHVCTCCTRAPRVF